MTGLLVGGLCRANDAVVEETLRVRWTEAYNSGDIEALSAMYAADARLLSLVTGRADVAVVMRQLIDGLVFCGASSGRCCAR
jgi:ketosteroid isomerase-like protein